MEKLLSKAQQDRNLRFGKIKRSYFDLKSAGTATTVAVISVADIYGASIATIYKAIRSDAPMAKQEGL